MTLKLPKASGNFGPHLVNWHLKFSHTYRMNEGWNFNSGNFLFTTDTK